MRLYWPRFELGELMLCYDQINFRFSPSSLSKVRSVLTFVFELCWLG